jgi:CRISPR-associated protein Csd1
MILQRLVEYYERIATDPSASNRLPKPGYSLQKISFCVVLSPDGRLQQFQSLLDAGIKRAVPRQLLVPGQSKSSGSGINPCFLWDNAAYMLGFKLDDSNAQRTRECFIAFREKHASVEKEVNGAAFTAVCNFLRHWSPTACTRYSDDLEHIVGNFGVFRIAGQELFVHDDPCVITWWQSRLSQAASGHQEVCLVTGRESSIARLHEPKIKGVRGTQSSGALLVSFNDSAYESFGKSQSYNAPVSTSAAFKYTNALNFLLSREDRRVLLGDATVVFWAERPTQVEDFLSDLLSESSSPGPDARPEDKRRADEIRLFLSQLREGRAAENAFDTTRGTRFYILGLSPNASRIAVRFWADTTVAELEGALLQHIQDVELAGSRESEPPLIIKRIVQATGRAETDARGHFETYDSDSVSPLLAGAVARAVLTGGPYPGALLSAMIRRIRSDGVISHPRLAAIKACLVRNARLKRNPKEVSVALDTTRSEPAYVTGRLFALLEKIQEDSSEGELNTTIKDRYFSSASATPRVVFPRLIRLSQHHLAKIDGGLKIYREKQLGEIMGKLDRFPTRFSLEDQGLFAVGYFHQRQDFFTRKDSKPKEGESA